eukprot:scaffold12165_cov102-Isochrysis_galbana.AAC.3
MCAAPSAMPCVSFSSFSTRAAAVRQPGCAMGLCLCNYAALIKCTHASRGSRRHNSNCTLHCLLCCLTTRRTLAAHLSTSGRMHLRSGGEVRTHPVKAGQS